MRNSHKIKNVNFDFRMDSEEQSFEIQDDLHTLINGKILDIFESVFNHVAPQHQIVKIENLELDLGIVNTDNYKEEIPYRLKEKLTELLLEKIHYLEYSSSANEKIISTKESYLEQFLYYLEYGFLPWYAEKSTRTSLQSLLHSILTTESALFVERLYIYGKNENVRKRLLLQFDDSDIERIIVLLKPAEAQFIINYTADIRQLHRKHPVVNANEKEFRNSTWEIVLASILNNKGTYFNQKMFVKQMINQLSLHYNVSYQKLLDMLSKTIPLIHKGYHFSSSLPHIISELHTEEIESHNQNISEPLKKTQIKEALSLLSKLLEQHQRQSFNKESFSKIWVLLKESAAPETREILYKYGKKAIVRHYIAHYFTIKQLIDTVILVEPENSDFIINYSENLDLISSTPRYPEIKAADYSLLKWEFILTYLLAERGTAFNQKSFIKSTLRQTSHHYNIEYSQLLAFFVDAYQINNTIHTPSNRLTIILKELQHELVIEQQKRVNPNQEDKQLFRYFEAKEALFYWLKNGKAAQINYPHLEVSTIAELLELVKEYYPNILVDIFSEMKSSERFCTQIIKANNPETLHSLIFCLISTQNKSQEDLIQTFIQSIEKFSKQAKYKQSYYFKVIRHILCGEVVDFESIICDSEVIEEKKTKLHITETTDLPQASINIILQRRSLSDTDKIVYLKQLNKLLQCDSKVISHFLSALLSDKQKAEAFFIYTPDDILLQIIRQCNTNAQYHTLWRLLLACSPSNGNRVFEIIYLKELLKSKTISIENVVSNIFIQLSPYLDTAELSSKMGVLIQQNQFKNLEKSLRKLLVFNAQNKEDKLIAITHEFNLIAIKSETLATHEKIQLIHLTEDLLSHPDSFYPLLLKLLKSKQFIKNIITYLPESLLIRIFHLLLPEQAHKIVICVNIITHIFNHKIQNTEPPISAQRQWGVLFFYLSNSQVFNEEDIIQHFIEQLHLDSENKNILLEIIQKEISSLSLVSSKKMQTAILFMIQNIQKKSNYKPSPKNKLLKINEAMTNKTITNEEITNDEAPDFNEDIYINNAGLVLTAPYLPVLFKKLKLMTDGIFNSSEAQEKAIYILQYLVEGPNDTPEHLLVLNKLLCGYPLNEPIMNKIEITDYEASVITSLLLGIIDNWKAIGHTSIEGFRSSFLMREGRLRLKEENWYLVVEEKAYDILLDQIPWSYSPISLKCMDKLLYVKWR